MGFLLKKMLRDMKNNWTQFASVFLMATISIMIFSGMASIWTGMNHQVKTYTEKTNMSDLWVNAMRITSEDVKALQKISNVKAVTLAMNMTSNLVGGNGELEIVTTDNLRVTKPLCMDGEQVELDKSGIWINKEYAEAHSIKPGDTVNIDSQLEVKKLTVRGTIMSPEYIYYTGNVTETVPNYEKYGYAVVGNETMLELCPKIVYSQARLQTDGEVSESEIEEIFGDRFIGIRDKDNYTSYSRVTQESQQMQKMAMLFSIVFILLALLTMYTSMVRLVNNQMMQIGSMKAIGISDHAIRMHYASYGVVIPVIGGILGLIIGRLTVSQALMKVKQTTISLPQWELIHSKISFLLIVFIALSCMFASIWATKKGLYLMPVETMRGNTGSNTYNKKKVVNGKLIEKLSYGWRWSLRDIMRNKVRFIMGIIGVMGGMVLIIAGLGIQNAINYSNDYVFEKQFHYDTKGILKVPGKPIEVKEEHQWLQESNIDIKSSNQNGDVKRSVLTLCGEGDMIRFFDDKDNKIVLPKTGALISRKLAEDIGVKKGDILSMRIFGMNTWIEVEISDVTKFLSPQGLFLSKDAYEVLGQNFIETSLLINSLSTEELQENDAIKSAISRKKQFENTQIVANSALSIVKLLILASIVLSVVILYNLGILSYVERIREYATMKVIGFYQHEIRNIAIKDCILTTVIGWPLGLLLGIKFLKIYVKIISFDTFEWIFSVNVSTLIISSIVIVGISFIINLVLSNKVKKIVMVEALKSVE